MGFLTYINTPSYKMERPVDSVPDSFTAKAPVAKYYRKTISCCDNDTTEVIKDVKCCVKPIFSANTNIDKNYYATHSQYIKAKCLSYDQNNTPTPNCADVSCNFNVYKRSNPTFNKQGSVSSSSRILQLKYNTIQRNARFNPYQSNYTG